MAQDVLSQEELDALLAPGEGAAAARSVVEVDLARPAKLNAHQLRQLTRLHEALAARLGETLSSALRLEIQVQLVSLGELTFEVFRNSLPTPTTLQVLSLDGLAPRALCSLDLKTLLACIDRLLGGRGQALAQTRPPTSLEQGFADSVFARITARWAEAWKELAPFTPQVVSRETDPQVVQAVPAHEMVLVATFSVAGPEGFGPGDLCLCIPFLHLETVLARLASPGTVAAVPKPQGPEARAHLEGVVKQATVPVQVRLGTTTLSLGEVLAMQAGDVLVLDQRLGAPAQAMVAGRLRAIGKAGRLGRRLAFVVEKTIPAPRQPER